ncbi:hypothetical protein B0H14DRAFT_2629127 [Mycena olivaceomarginata]|nr:hypothetical protein B0H14DRAFT_2629127 [Mycena olivaceomarginata]
MRTKTPSSYWFLALRYGALMTNLPVVVFSFVGLPSHKCACVVVVDRNRDMSDGSCCVGRGGRPAWTFHHRILGMSFVHRSIRSWSSDLAIAWECLFAFDSIIFSLTVYNGYLTRRAVGRGQAMPIHRLMVRDEIAPQTVNYDSAARWLSRILRISSPFSSTEYATPKFAHNHETDWPQRLLPGSLATFATWYSNCMSVAMATHLLLDLYECIEYGARVPNFSEV